MLERTGSPPYHPPQKNLLLHTHTPTPKGKKIILYTNTSLRNSCKDMPQSNGYNFPTPTPTKIQYLYPKGNSGISGMSAPPLRIMTPLPTPKEKKNNTHTLVSPSWNSDHVTLRI